MRAVPVVLLQTLHQFALAVWLGGLLVLGAVAAPAVFGAARASGDTEWGMPLYNFAGVAMGEAFGRFQWLALLSGAVALITGAIYPPLAGLCRMRRTVRAALTVLALAVTAYQVLVLFPEMTAARLSGRRDAFEELHQAYSASGRFQALVLFAVMALTGWLHLDREPHGTRDTPSQATPEALPLSGEATQ
ncbi:MAG: DUF4149 domain-containing protein [Armatimonadetes bacterium]|nr:DUF4149 domain-containing protein [Armatimonadota bacterium]